MNKKRIYILIVIIGLLFSISLINTSQQQSHINKLVQSEVSRITLKHYETVIELDSQDPNFNKIVELSSQIKIGRKYLGLPLMGTPIEVTFYNNTEEILTLAPGIKYTDINNKRYYTKKSIRSIAEQLDTILGTYYGYTQ